MTTPTPIPLPVFTSPQGRTATLQAYQAVLKQWPVPYTELDIPTSFGQTHVIASGPAEAPPLVLLHALFATATAWYTSAGVLSRYYRTYAVDILGEANQSCPTRPMASLEDFLQWFTELIDALGARNLYLVGNSYGGFTAAYYAMRLHERVRKLVLVGPAATFRPMLPFYANMFLPKAMYMFFPRLPGMKRVMRHSVDWMNADLPRDAAWERLFYLCMLYGSMTNRVLPRVYTKEELAQIKIPTLLVLGDRERIYRPQDAIRSAQQLMPGIRVEVIPNAHHITAIANPGCFNKCLLAFLGEG